MSEQKPGVPNEQPELSAADDLQMALAAFGDDLLDILNEGEDEEAIPSVESPIDSGPVDSAADEAPNANHAKPNPCEHDLGEASAVDPLERLLEQYGDKLNDDSNLAYAGSIALACSTAADSTSRADSRYIVFAIGDQRFGLPLTAVIEVAQRGNITPLPRTAGWLKGVTNLRGNMLSVTDLARLLDIPTTGSDAQKFVVLQSHESQSTSALLVDRIHGIRNLETDMLDPADPADRIGALASGMAKIDDTRVILIDPDRLLGCPELTAYMN